MKTLRTKNGNALGESLSLSECSLARLREKLWMDFEEIFSICQKLTNKNVKCTWRWSALSECSLARWRENLWMDFDEIFSIYQILSHKNVKCTCRRSALSEWSLVCIIFMVSTLLSKNCSLILYIPYLLASNYFINIWRYYMTPKMH